MVISIKPSLILLLLLVFSFSVDTFGQRRKKVIPPPPPRAAVIPLKTDKLTPDQKRRVEAFEKVWRTIYFYYYDEKFNNVNWEALKFEFEPKVLSSKTDEELHDILELMIGRLRVSHLGIIRPAVYQTIEAAKETARRRAAERELRLGLRSGDDDYDLDEDDFSLDDPLSVYGPGIDLRIIDNKFVVFRVGANSAAEYRGIKPGYVIESIDDVSLSMLLARLSLIDKGDPRVRRYLPVEIVQEMLNGEKDSTVKIGYLDENDKPQEVIVRRERIRGVTVSLGGDVPERSLRFERRSIDDTTGYVFFDNFSLPVVEQFCSALEDFKDKKSLIIDLRGNLGGIMGILTGLSGMLSDKPIFIGTSVYRFGPESMMARPKARRFTGKIVILVDDISVSAAEMFASAMQASGRAVLIGERTAGETLPAIAVDLPTGARLYYPIANFRTSSGKFLEGHGVVPDRPVRLDRAALLSGKDPQLEAALEVLRIAEDATRTGGIGTSLPAGPSEPTAKLGTGGTSGAPPPPPPPAAPKSPLKNLGTVTITAPPAPREPPDVIEAKAVEFIKDFEKLSGGYEAYTSIKNYEIKGSVETVAMGARDTKEYAAYREGDVRHLTIVTSHATGEVRNFRDGKTIRIKSDYGLDLDEPHKISISETDFLYSITRSMKPENYTKLLYLGVFDRGERKVHLIDGKTKDGVTVAIYFDTETKLLSGFEGPTGGLSFADYRKIGDIMFPYNISSQDFLNIQLTEVKLNTEIDPAIFERKLNCFDIP